MSIKFTFCLTFFSLMAFINLISQPLDDPSPLLAPPPQQDVTDINIAQPQHVLVVYNSNSQISIDVKNYYASVRQIPTLNIIGLAIPRQKFYGAERVYLFQEGEIIRRDHPCANYNSNCYCTDTYAWDFYNEEIAMPIANYLNNTIDPNTGQYLRDQINYIVCAKAFL